jgi:aminoglycoside phosphotransferase (APT) family kinase protein
MGATSDKADVALTAEAAARLEREPLIVLEPLRRFLDERRLGSGPLLAEPVGEGHSNVSYLLRRGGLRMVLRRPPRGPLPPSAHDMLREARLLEALAPAGVRVPQVLATCEDRAVIGAPFYLMEFLDGYVLMTKLPPQLAATEMRGEIGSQVVDALVELHAVDLDAAGLDGFGRPGGYLERQIDRFSGLLEDQATRPLPELERVTGWLRANVPESVATTVVHGDFRLGNMMLDLAGERPRLMAILDWELTALGDPLADIGYLTAMWAEPGDPPNPMLDLSAVTREPGFQSRAELAERYAECTGRSLDALAWYQVLALWKAAIFLEGSYGRFLSGSTDDEFFGSLGEGVPILARRAWERTRE